MSVRSLSANRTIRTALRAREADELKDIMNQYAHTLDDSNVPTGSVVYHPGHHTTHSTSHCIRNGAIRPSVYISPEGSMQSDLCCMLLGESDSPWYMSRRRGMAGSGRVGRETLSRQMKLAYEEMCCFGVEQELYSLHCGIGRHVVRWRPYPGSPLVVPMNQMGQTWERHWNAMPRGCTRRYRN